MKVKKTLHIVRHAKSTWDYESITDADRPLKLKGIKNAYEMARRMKIRNSLPEFIISSPANRALHTAVIFARVIELPFSKLKIDSALYCSDPSGILDLVKSTDNAVKSVMIFGHNPDLTYLASQLTNDNTLEMPTSGIVSVTFSVNNWSEIGKDSVIAVNFDFPKKDLQAETL